MLSLLNTERDSIRLLTPKNLWEVFDHKEEFILSKVPRLIFEGLGDAQAREQVQSRLLTQIKEASEEISGGDFRENYPFVAPPPPESLPTRMKRSMELEADTMSKLCQRAANKRPQHAGGRAFVPWQREAT